MRLRTLGLAAVVAMSMVSASSAFVPPHVKQQQRSFVTTGRPARAARLVRWAPPSALPGWTAMWDRDTDVPLRMWGPGAVIPGSTADATVAESAARRFLADHLSLLAPGAQLGDFVLVANQLGGASDTRTVAFEQRANGLRVLGGSVGFAFKGDHLSLVSSTALPNVTAPVPAARLPRVGLAANAQAWMAGYGKAVRERVQRPAFLPPAGEQIVLPIVHGPGDIEFHTVETVLVETTSGAAGRWLAYLDAKTGAPIARHDVLESFTGTIEFDTPDQSPSQPRGNPKPAPFLNTVINGQAVTTDGSGVATFTGADPATVQPKLSGTFVAMSDAAESLSTDTLTLPSNGSAVWSKATIPFADAELDAYINENTIKAFAKATIPLNATAMQWVNQQISVTVNEGTPTDPNQSCNAYSTGDDVHFYVPGPLTLPNGGSGACENTGRMADVLFHETGHSIHNNSVIPGQGAFGFGGAQGLSEGLADTTAIAITGDHGLGRGFFLDDEPLRDVAPAVPKTWPVASGEPHAEGEIIGESLWDTREALEAKLGPQAGFAQLIKIYYGIMQRSPDIPSSYAEALLADDDDGDLTNGTPNQCEITTAFARHNLADAATELGLELTPPVLANGAVSFTAPTATGSCPPAATVTGARLAYHTRANPTDQTVALAASGQTYSVALPTAAEGDTLFYQVQIELSGGLTLVYPQNPADPYYEQYVGTAQNIYCTSFEPGFDGWTHSGTKDEWQAGLPDGAGGDPRVAHTGSGAVGIDLGVKGGGANGDGSYESSARESLVSPMIPTGGAKNVHLQYWRWLGVEDAEFDHATISANGTQVWVNKTTGQDPQGTDEVNHVDHEWVFEDVDLTPAIGAGSSVQVTFGLTSDEGLELSGWTLDDVCVVSVAPAPPGVGSGSGSGSGSGTGSDGTQPEDDGGCATTGGGCGGALVLLALGGLVIRRRR